MKTGRRLAQIVCLAIPLAQCTAPPRPPASVDRPWFEEIAARAGIDFVHRSGHRDKFLLPEIMGGGAALFDMDNDGYLDLYVVQSGSLFERTPPGQGNRLYRNRGNGTFEDVTAGSGADVAGGYGMGVTAGDFDNDGNADLYVTNYGANILLKGDGHGHFTDVTAAAGVASGGWSTSAAFIDYDGDGALDLFVVHYLNWKPAAEVECFSPTMLPDYCSPKTFDLPSASTLYHNNGNGTFTDVSEKTGINRAVGNGLGVVAGDVDGDGRIDIFVANDSTPNHLWLNRGGRFEESAFAMGCAVDNDGRAKAGMGVGMADLDDDGDLDLMVVNFDGEADSFFRNEKTFFRDDTAAIGLRTVSKAFNRFGMGLLDFDNDGRLDLYEANGRVLLRDGPRSGDPYAEANLVFRGVAGPRFEEVKPRGGTSQLLVATSRGAAFGDIDNDGGVDIVVINRDAAPYVLHNIVQRRGHWATFRVVDEHGRDAIGAELRIDAGGRAVRRDVRAAYSYLSSNDPRVHVGLGSSTSVERITVRWPDGRREIFGTQPIDKVVTLRRGAGRSE